MSVSDSPLHFSVSWSKVKPEGHLTVRVKKLSSDKTLVLGAAGGVVSSLLARIVSGSTVAFVLVLEAIGADVSKVSIYSKSGLGGRTGGIGIA